MSWYVASLGDGDTHLVREVHDSELDDGEFAVVEVRALCGQRFRPLTRLVGQPPDPLQVCRSCWESLRSINA